MSKIGLVWLGNDIRMHDNATISQASNNCDSLVFVYARFAPKQSRNQCFHMAYHGDSKQLFLQQSLIDFDASLAKLGQQLVFVDNCSTHDIVNLCTEVGVTDVYYSKSHDYDHNKQIQKVCSALPQLTSHAFVTATLFDEQPTVVLPEIFSQFRKKIEKTKHLLRDDLDYQQYPTVRSLPAVPGSLYSALTQDDSDHHTNNTHTAYVRLFKDSALANANFDNGTSVFTGGESSALEHIHSYFESDAPSVYKQTRNALDTWEDSTKFSPWLAHGNLSVREVLTQLIEYEQTQVANEDTYWIWFELLWREYFYWYAVEHQSTMFDARGLDEHKRTNLGSFYGERFAQWVNGTTPYPIVNACMKQLKATGYMSNRGRQLVASCFVHELGLDWRYGATYFEQMLVDYDVGSNWGNWQYLAGVGADPRGHRQFNLKKQAQVYDPKDAFIKKWKGKETCLPLDSQDMTGWPTWAK